MTNNNKRLTCERCGSETDWWTTIHLKEEDEFGDEKETQMKVCWDCDWEITNGQGELEDDSGIVLACRRENNYEYDPINVERPY